MSETHQFADGLSVLEQRVTHLKSMEAALERRIEEAQAGLDDLVKQRSETGSARNRLQLAIYALRKAPE